MSVKIARKPSSDPVQEKLRQDKANWNKEMSLFLNDVIHLKKLMNGWPSKFYKERSRIVEPIPADPTTIIGSLTNDFQELSQRGNSIVQEQLNYSKNRKPKQPKAPEGVVPTTTPPASTTPPVVPDLGKQLAAWEQKYDLVSEGSNPVSRFLTRRITRTRGTSEKFRINRMRLDMLESCAKARKALSKLQVQIVKGNKQSILDSQKTMQHVWNEWAIVARSFNNYKSKVGQLPDKSVELPTDEAMSPEKEVLPNQAPQEKDETLSEAPKVVPPVPIPPVVPASAALPMAPNIPPTDADELPKIAAMEVVAQAFLQKWLGKKRHQFFSGSSSSYRLEIFEIAKNIRVKLNEIMNLLEKGLDIGQLDPLVSDVNRQISSVRMLMRSLHLSEKPDASGGSIF
jgi:hypothetical protein